ncbi:MAG TPA: P-loop NTPase fold protein [Sulfurovum sp.]|uniref:P-loop NTPase fold protein n=1 Tax=Sulfurovum sp. TaxID=1969726 RepID=UPI002F958BD3
MSSSKELRDYLINTEDGFLLNSDNNGKTIMLSGAWGAGKTHFWQNEIETILSDKLAKDSKACVYVSLYGKESISEIKYDIFKEAYNSLVAEDTISKSASFISSLAPSFGEKSLVDGFEKLNQKSKDKKSVEILKDGSVICLDDFERKSKKIDLNDLFGLISHLALSLDCKVVIILNSDVFKEDEANVFKNVKEKTVNKFFYFEPTIEELFYSIVVDVKYNNLKSYLEDILNVIKETEELNARIYIQVLDNCLEWINKGYSSDALRPLVLSTVCFIQNHFILNYSHRNSVDDSQSHSIVYDLVDNYPDAILAYIKRTSGVNYGNETEFFDYHENSTVIEFIDRIKKYVGQKNSKGEFVYSESRQNEYSKWIDNHISELQALYKYGYQLHFLDDVGNDIYNKITYFIKSGILEKVKM